VFLWTRAYYNAVGRVMGVLHAGGDRRREGVLLRLNAGPPIETDGDNVA